MNKSIVQLDETLKKTMSSLLALPQLVLEIIVQDNCVESMADVPRLVLVCKRFLQLLTKDASANAMWKRLATTRWVFVALHNKSQPVDDWLLFCKRRSIALVESPSEVAVSNCLEWKLKCPIALEHLSRTADPKIDFCSVCKENIFLCTSIEELADHVTQSHCVAFVEDMASLPRFAPRRQMMRGRIVRR